MDIITVYKYHIERKRDTYTDRDRFRLMEKERLRRENLGGGGNI